VHSTDLDLHDIRDRLREEQVQAQTFPMPDRAHGAQLVGRQRELATVSRWLSERDGGVLLLSGEAGIGKTVLLDAVISLTTSPDDVVELRCTQRPRRPLGPLRDVIDEGDAASADRYGPLRQLLAEAPGSGDVLARVRDAEQTVERVADGFARAMSGLVVVLEDLHWADATTARLVDVLAADADRLSVRLIVSGRNRPAAFDVPLSSLARMALELQPLAAADTVALAERLLGRKLEADRGAEIVAWSGGNPFVIESVTSHISAHRLLADDDDRSRGEPLPTALCPPELAAWMIGEHARVPAAIRPILDAAALLGEPISPRILQALQHSQARSNVVADLEATGLVVSVPSTGQLRFRHGLIRSAIESRINGARRIELHVALAQALQELEPHRSSDIATHLAAAGQAAEAAPYQLAAANSALRVASYAEAHDLLVGALPHLSGVDEGTAWCHLGLALHQLGSAREGVDALGRGVGLLDAAGRPLDAGREGVLLGHFLFGVEGPSASAQQYRRARDQLRPGGDSEALALSEVLCGATHVVAERMAEARTDIERGLEMAARCGSPAVTAWGHQFLGVVETKTGAVARGLDLLDRSYRAGVDLDLDVLAQNALFNACVSRQLGMRAREVETRLRAHRSGSESQMWALRRDSVLLGALVELGEIGRALELTDSLRRRLRDAGAHAMLGWADAGRSLMLSEAGALDEASSLLRGLDGTDGQDLALWAAVHVRYLLVAGDDAGAAEVADEALERTRSPGVHHRLAVAAAQAFFADRRSDDLERLRERVVSDPGLATTPWSEYVEGHAALCRQDVVAARAILARAARDFGAASYRLPFARCRALLGVATGPRDGQRLVDDAQRVLSELGAGGTATELTRLVEREWPASSPPHALTSREREVVRLVASGLTDDQIARAMQISRRTVTSHLDRIRDKTGRRRRADLTRLAVDLRLTDPEKG
jgi:DNA-binding CsgD family transcriptional regulator